MGRQPSQNPESGQRKHLALTARARPALPQPPYLVAGLGRAGLAAIAALRRRVAPELLYGWDASTDSSVRASSAELRRAGITTWLGQPPALEGPLARCAVIKSPGIPYDVPLLQQAQREESPVFDELELGWRLCNAPMLAVTGTNGKSTVCALLSAIATAAGMEAPVAGNSHFAPPLSAFAGNDPDLLVCEVSSFQLEGCQQLLPEAAVLTNIRPEHLNRHGTIDVYADCKRRLFLRGEEVTPLAVLNLDDPRACGLAETIRARGGRVVGYGRSGAAEFRLLRCSWTLVSGRLEVETPEGTVELSTNLPGAHNAENVVAALAAAHSLGFALDAIAHAFERTPGVPGRFEQIVVGQRFDVIVDFAHTPDAVATVMDATRAIVDSRPGARLHALVSVSGHRSSELSAPIGEAAARRADRLVLTEGSRYGRTSEEVLAPLRHGARSVAGAEVAVVPDRRTAIRVVLASACAGDVVLILGRGAIPRLVSAADGAGVEFDDRTVVRDELLTELARSQREDRAL